MSERVIQNYEHVKVHLAALSHEFNGRGCDYYFAVADLFNENVPPNSARNRGGIRMSAATYNHMLRVEIKALLHETETNISYDQLKDIRSTARAWPKNKRKARCAHGTYRALASHPDRFKLIRDGMTEHEARVLKADTLGDPEWVERLEGARESAAQRMARRRMSAYNRTQRLRLGVNNLRGAVDADDATPLTEEQIALIGEAYAVLDAYCASKGIDMWDDGAQEEAA